MLTDILCKSASCPAGKARARFSDDKGLYLEVAPNGSKRWFAKYRFQGKEKRIALGSYPEVSLKAARLARDDARRDQAQGTDPVQKRKAENATKALLNATTFEAVAREFHGVKSSGWSEGHASKWLRMNELYLFPHLGSLPLSDIKAPALLAALRRVEAKGILSTAQDLQAMAGQVFRYGIQTGRCTSNPAESMRGALTPHVPKHFAAVLDPVRVGELLRAIDSYTGQPVTVAALKVSALFFQRPGNIRALEWAWVDLDSKMLSIPAVEMKSSLHQKKNGKAHLVPLADQAVRILSDLKGLTGQGRYVFPSARTGSRPMSDGTINAALRRMDFPSDEMVAHGFRAMARTMLTERLPGIPAEVVEAQLAHGKSGPLGAAYDRAEYVDQRRAVMQTWADYLDRLRQGADVIPLRTGTA